mgnify:CR=1 FL=1
MLTALAGALGPLGYKRGGAMAMDADAAAFIAAAGISDATQSSAVNTLTTALKSASLWSKLKAAYPFVGGSAAAHKWNLKDPRDLDAAFRLGFSGTWTHDANGIQGNASTAYANTFLSPSTVLSASSGCYGVYSRSAASALSTWYDMAAGAGASLGTILICRYSNGNAYWCYGEGSSFVYNTTVADGSGLFACNRQNGTYTEGWRNGVKVGQGPSTPSLHAAPLFIGAYNGNGSAARHSGRPYAFAFVSDGLSDAESAALYSAVQAFQTTLGRQV